MKAKSEVMSACGVLCSGCPAYRGKQKGVAHQKRTAEAWNRIYRLHEKPENISCRGCQGPEDQLFHTCRRCKAQRCCRAKGFRNCAECDVKSCAKLERAQSLWDGVPKLVEILSKEDLRTYAQPYCGHRERLEQARQAAQKRWRLGH